MKDLIKEIEKIIKLVKENNIKNNVDIIATLLALKIKIEQFENLEEQLGVPLDVVFKALQEELEYIANGVRIEGTLSQIYYSIGGYWMGEFVPKGYILGEREYLTKRIPLKDYQKNWWLKGDIRE